VLGSLGELTLLGELGSLGELTLLGEFGSPLGWLT